MKKAMIVVSVLLLSVLVIANTGAKIEMRNGDVIECEINMESISFITDYGELKIPVSFVREIVFPAPGNRVTTLNTVFPNETFGGFLLDEYISISLLGNPIRFHKDAIGKIRIYNDSQIIAKEVVQANLKTGDIFYGEMLSTGIKIQTSYGEFEIVTENIEGMEFEGEGNVLTKIRLKNSSEMRGTIKDDFIVFKLLSGSELSVSPGKIRSIVFLKDKVLGIENGQAMSEDTDISQNSYLSGDPTSSGSVNIPENMVLVEKGSFTFGDIWEGIEVPLSKVTFTYDFYMGKYEVTFDEYEEFVVDTAARRPSDNGFGRGQRPVIDVNWWDAIEYCNWLSEKEGLPKAYNENGDFVDRDGQVTTDPSHVVGYRLPTEAEWEYAARGGQNNDRYKYSGSDNVDDVAWYSFNSTNKAQEVGTKRSNTIGIYDMSGNVWEWCSDNYDLYSSTEKTNPFSDNGSCRVCRGGSWNYTNADATVANRNCEPPSFASYSLGFRICRTISN